jgi:plasmid replication initiation protein
MYNYTQKKWNLFMSNIVAYKSNWLIEASYKLTLQEQRFLLCCIGKLNPDSTNKKMTVTAMEFYNCFPDIGLGNAEREMEKAIDRLWERSVIVRDPNQTETFRWIQTKAKYIKGEARCSIVFSDAIMPYLTQLKGQFTKVIVKNVSSLTSVYSIRLYELLQQYLVIGSRIVTLEEFRGMLDIKERYSTFKSLNQWVIKPSLKELNDKSNLDVTLSYIKDGRRISALKFSFLEKNTIKKSY